MTSFPGQLLDADPTIYGRANGRRPGVLYGEVAGADLARRMVMLWQYLGSSYTWLASSADPTGLEYPTTPPAPIAGARVLGTLP